MYFKNKGAHNTQATVQLAIKTAKERGIGHIVISSNTGNSAILCAGSGLHVVCVAHTYGFVEKGENEMTNDMRKKLTDNGIDVLATTHVLSGVERCFSKRYGGTYPTEIMAHTLRMFGQGTKVCVECATMALDAGLIPYGEEIIALGGTGRGVDTAIILSPEHAQCILDTRMHEIICKPYHP